MDYSQDNDRFSAHQRETHINAQIVELKNKQALKPLKDQVNLISILPDLETRCEHLIHALSVFSNDPDIFQLRQKNDEVKILMILGEKLSSVDRLISFYIHGQDPIDFEDPTDTPMDIEELRDHLRQDPWPFYEDFRDLEEKDWRLGILKTYEETGNYMKALEYAIQKIDLTEAEMYTNVGTRIDFYVNRLFEDANIDIRIS